MSAPFEFDVEACFAFARAGLKIMLLGSVLVRSEPLVMAAGPEVEAVLDLRPSTQELWEIVGAVALWFPQLCGTGGAEEKPLSAERPLQFV